MTTEAFTGASTAPVLHKDTDLVVGDFSWTRAALARLGVPMPPAPDYPDCLRSLLHRRVWRSTLGELAEQVAAAPPSAPQLFFKPADDIKAFTGELTSPDWMRYLLDDAGVAPSCGVIVSELVTIVAEYRVYVVHGAVRAVCQYKGPADASLDLDVVHAAVHTLTTEAPAAERLDGYGIDFAVMRPPGAAPDAPLVTGLVEVNDGFSLGCYDGLDAKDYTDMLVARWAQLVGAGGKIE
jgi:hypothetical protein